MAKTNKASSIFYIINEVKRYYYTTMQGLKDLTLHIPLECIVLDSSYPYYEYGLRGIEFNDTGLISCLYVSMNFLLEENITLLSSLVSRYKLVVCDYSDYKKNNKYIHIRGLEFIDYAIKDNLLLTSYDFRKISNFLFKDWNHLNGLNINLKFEDINEIRFIFKDNYLVDNSIESIIKSYMDYFVNLYENYNLIPFKQHLLFYFYELKPEIEGDKLNKFFIVFIEYYKNLDRDIKDFINKNIFLDIYTWNKLKIDDMILKELECLFIVEYDFQESPLLWNFDFLDF